ncbi:DUF1796 family putative cysteine peptidase [Niallia taxi]|nr:DUF1796 family putative cysteine peptidase [Niallia taxi]MDE5055420.1 DUF1796 family putative cysteine peptidase [Niallia taxi]
MPQVQKKYEKRITRFIDTLASAQHLLFIRTEADWMDTVGLEKVLSHLVRHDYTILIVNHTPVKEILELDWKINNVYVCAIEIPNDEIWEGNNSLWERIFQCITLV